MYGILFFVLIIAIMFIAFEKNITNPIIIFSFIWIFSLLLSSLNLYGMIEVSDKSKYLILIGILSFILGATVIYFIYKNCNKKEKGKNSFVFEEKINYKIVNLLLIIGIILVAFLAIKVTSKIISGVKYSDIRAMYYSYGDKESLVKNETIFTIIDWASAVILTSVTPIVILDIFKKRIHITSTVLLIIFTMLHIYSTAGRTQLFVIVLEILLTFFLVSSNINLRKLKNIGKVIVVFLIGIIFVSIFRDNSSKKSVNQWYAYFSLPSPYFSKMVDYVDNEKIKTHGIATLYGPYLLVQKSIKCLTGYKLKNADYYFNVINRPQNYWVKIFENSPDYYNAYGTMFYNFYLDGGIFGIIIASIIYGIFMEKIYLDAKYRKDTFQQVLYLIFMVGLCNSFIRWHFSSATIFISVLVVRIIVQKKKKEKKENKTKKVLVFGMTENPGGIESVIMNYYRKINKDNVKFDFLCNTEQVAYDKEIEKLGGKIFRVTPRSKNRIQFKIDMNRFFKKNGEEYSAIWVNVCSLANIDYLKYAKKYEIRKRIIHCHNSQNMDSFIRGMLHKWNRIWIRFYATDFWSCASEASEWFYNKKIIQSDRYCIIKNAIDYKKYAFNEKIRNEYRNKLNFSNKIVLGNIGRLHFQKNQMFLIDIFEKLHTKNNEFKLILVGDGEDREKIKNKIATLKLEDSIFLLGVRDDVNNIIQAMDILVFPSLFEGLPLTLIEAQANGLPIFSSDNITREIKIGENIEFISLKKSAEEWADIIWENYKKHNLERVNNYEKIVKSGYEIDSEVKKIEAYFERD